MKSQPSGNYCNLESIDTICLTPREYMGPRSQQEHLAIGEVNVTTDQFQQIADLLPGGALLLSAEGKIVAASVAVKVGWQLEPEALVGQSLASLVTTPVAEIETFL